MVWNYMLTWKLNLKPWAKVYRLLSEPSYQYVWRGKPCHRARCIVPFNWERRGHRPAVPEGRLKYKCISKQCCIYNNIIFSETWFWLKYVSKMQNTHQLRARRMLTLCNDVLLRTRRALSLYRVNGESALPVFNKTVLNSLLMPFWFSAGDMWVFQNDICNKALMKLFTNVNLHIYQSSVKMSLKHIWKCWWYARKELIYYLNPLHWIINKPSVECTFCANYSFVD